MRDNDGFLLFYPTSLYIDLHLSEHQGVSDKEANPPDT
jgi:hypothetical protein